MTYQLRAATEKDQSWLDDLRRVVYFDLMVDTFGQFEEDRHQRHCEDCWDQGNIQIVQVERVSAGMLQVIEGNSSIELCEIQIDPAQQGRGIGTTLLLDLISQADKARKDLVLSVALKNLRARQLYERLGFVVTRCGDTHHHMQYSADSHRR
jgi:ribosomal protein S18 acetylase RimI-like enzyme